MYIDSYACSNNENQSHEFPGEWEGVYGSVWREERAGRNYVITLKINKILQSILGEFLVLGYNLPTCDPHLCI